VPWLRFIRPGVSERTSDNRDVSQCRFQVAETFSGEADSTPSYGKFQIGSLLYQQIPARRSTAAPARPTSAIVTPIALSALSSDVLNLVIRTTRRSVYHAIGTRRKDGEIDPARTSARRWDPREALRDQSRGVLYRAMNGEVETSVAPARDCYVNLTIPSTSRGGSDREWDTEH